MVMEFSYNEVLEHVQINNIILSAAGEGVISGLDVSEQGTGANMSVDVATGSALLGGTTYTESSVVNLAISAADATHARKDLVIYDLATTNPLVVTGTPATPPIPPDTTSGDILLAIVDIAANETEITNSEITDCIVEVVTGGSLDGLSNVSIVSVTNLEILAWHTSSSKWINRTSAELDLATETWVNAQDFATETWVDAHNWAATDITSGTLAVARGGTGVTGDTYDARYVNGCDTGTATGDVFKISSLASGYLLQGLGAALTTTVPGTSGYVLTSNGAGNVVSWQTSADLIFSDTSCPKCGEEFQDGDDLVLHLIGHNEVGDILTIPMHLSCANQPKKTVRVKRKVFEDQYILDEDTGELVVQRVQKMVERVVTKHKLKEGYAIDSKTGKAREIDKDGKKGHTEYELSESLETVEETINEIIYEEVEYTL